MGKFSKFIGIVLIIFGVINLIDGITETGLAVFIFGTTQVTIGSYILGIIFIVIGFLIFRRE